MTAQADTIGREPLSPFRGELLSLDRLADEARGIAATQRWSSEPHPGATPLLPLVNSAALGLKTDNRELAQAVRAGAAASPAGEWLLDNHYLVEEQVLLVREDLPHDYGTELPWLTSGTMTDLPRIYEALLCLITHTDSRIEESSLLRFIQGYQDVSALTIGEIWAVPIAIRVGLVDNLSRLSREVVGSFQAERSADSWAERLVLAAQDSPEQLPEMLRQLSEQGNDARVPFLLRLSQRLGDVETGGEEINRWLEHSLNQAGISLHRAAADHQQRQAADQVSIANSITSIRFLDAFEWREFFERVSLVEAALHRDPAQTYGVMDFESRDRYRHALEVMSKRCPRSEMELAEAVLEHAARAMRADPADEIRGHVGWWLIGGGRYEIEQAVGYRPLRRERLYRGPLKNRALYYWGTLLALVAALLVMLALYALSRGTSVGATLAVALLALIPLSDIAIAITNRISAAVFPARILPKLDHRQSLAEAHRTLVVVPALLSSVKAVRSVIRNLEVTYLSNRDSNLGFGLLGDLRSADQASLPGDSVILEAAVRGIAELNQRYEAEHGVRPFHLLIRERTLNEAESSWMGWERKRGSLVELASEMRGEPGTSFGTKLGSVEFRRSCTFVITLDADTILPRDGARRLVSTIAHPLNRARWLPGDARVRKGYGLIQPRVGMTLAGSHRSRFARLYSGTTGIDPYAQAVSDTYQDVFGEGSFTGKGIFEVDVFRSVLDGRFPENSLLSHDLIEGSFLRTALASDVEVLDDYPANYLAAASRLHRWVRGDWQTLPYLADKISDANGIQTPNPLSGVQRYKILDNLRRSLVAPATILFLVGGWMLLGSTSPGWPFIVVLVAFFPAYFSLTDSLLFRPRSVSFASTAPSIIRDFALDSQRAALSFCTLPHHAWLMLDASSRALWRRYVTGKHLLEWETAADAEARAGKTVSAFWRTMGPPTAIALALLGISTLLEPKRLLAAVPVAVAWLAGPAFAQWVSTPVPPRETTPLSAPQRSTLRRVARKTWRFYDAFVVDRGHHLAPDNFQEDPRGVVAWRTSPTNVGLQLLSYLGAYDLGYLSLSDLVSRTSETLSAMAGLERFRGHFYNWYDIQTLEPLRPAYVSTVDSGNLAGHLLILRIGLLEASESPLLDAQLITGAHDAVVLALEDLVVEREHLGPEDAVRRMHEALDALERTLSLSAAPDDLGAWAAALSRLEGLADGVEGVLSELSEPYVDGETDPRRENSTDEVPIPATPLERLRASVGDAVRSVRKPGALIGELAPWAPLIAEAPREVPEVTDLAPLLA